MQRTTVLNVAANCIADPRLPTMSKAITLLVVVLGFAVPAIAQDSDPNLAAAEARLAAKQAAATQPAAMQSRIKQLEAETSALHVQVSLLEKRMASLEAEYAALKSQQANGPQSSEKAPADPIATDQQTAIAKAIKDHKLLNGMTVAQASQALALKFTKQSESSDGEVWKAAISTQTPITRIGNTNMVGGGDITGTAYTLIVSDGVVTNWSAEPFSMDPGQAHVSP